jgi:hypothetical protein
MGNFFRYAASPETEQKRFLEAVTNRRHVIASFPLGYPAISLYAFSVMLGARMSVAVAPDSQAIHRHVAYFKAAGYQFPDIVFLDGTQMPHEERAIREAINRHQVRLLYITPERFTSLTFLEILVKADLSFLVIEEAHRLLPNSPGYERYQRLWSQGLQSLREVPPLLLLTQPLPPDRIHELAWKLDIREFQRIDHASQIENVALRVERLWSEHQKFSRLTGILAGSPGRGRLGKLERTGPVLIQTAFPAQAEKLGASLLDYGFQSLAITHTRQSPKEQHDAMAIAATQANSIVVNGGVPAESWLPRREAKPRIVYWMPPAGLEELFANVFRYLPSLNERPNRPPGESGQLRATRWAEDTEDVEFEEDSLYPELSPFGMQGVMLYTREDFQRVMNRLRRQRSENSNNTQPPDFTALHERILALKRYRKWVLSQECRLKTLLAYYQPDAAEAMASCGHCDRCIAEEHTKHTAFDKISNLIRPLIF